MLALGAALGLVVIVRGQFPQRHATIGGSVIKAPVAAGQREGSRNQGSYEVAAPPTPDAEGFYPPTGMVYRCEGKGGQASFQSDPCGPGMRTTKAVHAPAERQRRITNVAVAPISAAGSSAQYARIPQPNAGQDTRDARCDQARRSRDQTLEHVGLARTYDLLQRLDAMVNEACK